MSTTVTPYPVPPPFDKPAVDPKTGLPTYQMAQWMQRVHALLNGTSGAGGGGTGGSGGSNSGTGLVDQINNISNTTDFLTVASSDDPIARAMVRHLAKVLASRPLPPHRAGVVTLQNGARLVDGWGVPNGAVFGSVGDIFLQRDGTGDDVVWFKATGSQTDTGWVGAGGGGTASTIYAPLVNGDLPGPTAIADPFGQFIMVPIT